VTNYTGEVVAVDTPCRSPFVGDDLLPGREITARDEAKQLDVGFNNQGRGCDGIFDAGRVRG
jgi:hypothetical protein